MAKAIVFDEFHLTVLVPAGLAKTEIRSAQRTLNSRRFQARLREAVNNTARRYRSLRSVKFTLSR